MGQKGMDFKHKEVINIKDGKRLRICTGCLCRFRKWNNYFYQGCKIENRYNSYNDLDDKEYSSFVFERKHKKNSYATKQNQKRTGYVINEKYVYDVVCKVEL